MNNKTISDTLKNIEKEINDMENINGIKKLVNKHNTISNNINNCKNILENISSSIKINEDISYSIECDKYIKNMEEIEQLRQKINNNMESLSIEELINIYNRALMLIRESTKYLKEQKMEIINID